MERISYPVVYVKEKAYYKIKQGHPWVFSNAIEKFPKIEDGAICSIYYKDKFLGIGYFNSQSDIRLRILTQKKEVIDKSFWENKLKILLKEKRKFLSHTNSWRWVFGESDGLPGLVVDIYDQYVVIQIHTLGMEKWKKTIVECIKKIYSPRGIYEKSDISIREKEGLLRREELLWGDVPEEIIINEHGFRFIVNIKKGQKTGFFLDQRENRKAILPYVKNSLVLNGFCYTGGFSVYAAQEAQKVISVDISKDALALAKANFKINGFKPEQHEFVCADFFDYLKEFPDKKAQVIILDPPALAKNQKQKQKALNAYLSLNAKALQKLPDYGILITSSCTTHVSESDFLNVLHKASLSANCEIRLLESHGQPLDHTYRFSFPEGRYLKFFIIQKWPYL